WRRALLPSGTAEGSWMRRPRSAGQHCALARCAKAPESRSRRWSMTSIVRDGGAGMMKTVRTVSELRQAVRAIRSQGLRLALVPTMGALHEGHMSLIRAGRQHADAVCVTIFVNPKQFGPNED